MERSSRRLDHQRLRVTLIMTRSRDHPKVKDSPRMGGGGRANFDVWIILVECARYTHLASGGFGARSIVKIINRKAQKRIPRHNKARDSTEREITWSRGGVSRLLVAIAYSYATCPVFGMVIFVRFRVCMVV